MNQKRIHLYPTATFPSLLGKAGRSPSEGVPFRWLETLVQEIKARIPDEEEQKTCMVYGTEALRAEYNHTLSPVEALTERVEDLEARRREAKGLLPREGETLRPEELARLRQLLEA